MRFAARSLASSTLIAALAWAVLGTATAQPAEACSGGSAFDWAVAHTRGGILQARVVNAGLRSDFTNDLVLSEVEVLRGEPPADLHLHAVAGAICEQSADAGETILLLFDVRGDGYVYPLPLFYVVDGPDALAPGAVVAALRALPASDTAGVDPGSFPWTGSPGLPAMLVAGFGGLLVAFRCLRNAQPGLRADR